MDYKDDDINLEEELKEAFQVLAIDVSPEMTDKNTQLNIDYFYTSFGQVEQQEATLMATDLANKAFSHSVTTADSIIPLITNKDPFIYNITISRYTVDCFLGIIIDIGASKRSIVRYSQFLVF